MADRHHRQGKAPIVPWTTAACPTSKVVQTRFYNDYSRLEESKHMHWEHSVAVGASALTEKHQTKKHHQIEKKHVIEKHVIEKHVIEKHVIEKHVIEKHRIESAPKHAHRQRVKEVVAVASGAHVVCEKKKAHKPKEATSGKKHGHHFF